MMENRENIEKVYNILKNEYSQSDIYDRVAISMFIFYIQKKYKYFSNKPSIKDFINMIKNNEQVHTEYEQKIIKRIIDDSYYNFDDNVYSSLITIYENLENANYNDFLNDFLYLNTSKSIASFSSINSVIQLSKRILNIKDNSSVLDLCSGYGDFLSSIYNTNDLTGIEINRTISLVSEIKLFFSRIYLDNFNVNNKCPKIVNQNALLCNFDDKKFDYIFCEAPFGLNVSSKFIDEMSEKSFLPIVNSRMSSAWLFVDQVLKALSDEGRAVVVINNAPLFKLTDYDYRLSVSLSGYIEMVIGLPGNLLVDTGIPISLLVLNKAKKNDVSVKLIDATNEYELGRRINTISSTNIDNIIKMINDTRFQIDVSDLEYNGYNLNPANYQEIEAIQYPTKLEEISFNIFRGVQLNAKLLDEIEAETNYSYKVLSLKNIGDFDIDLSNLLKINAEKEKYDKYLLKDFDFIISAKGSKIKTAVFRMDKGEKIIPEGNLMVIRLNQEEINPYYLKMFLDSNKGQSLLKRIQTGSFMISIGKGALNDFEIPLIPLEEQNEIVEKFINKINELNYHVKKTNELKQELEEILVNLDAGETISVKS